MERTDIKVDGIVFLRGRVASEVREEWGRSVVLVEPVDKTGHPIEGSLHHWVEVKHLVTLAEARAATNGRARKCESQ
jgi:hypothetical protein